MICARNAVWAGLWLLMAVGCRTLDPRVPPVPRIGPASLERVVRVPLYSSEPVYFSGGDAAVNRRQVDRMVRLPGPMADLTRVTLELRLACPDGGCDAWDRSGYLGIVQAPGGAAPRRDAIVGGAGVGGTSVLELVRFITPYGVGGEWTLDVTALVPLLYGERAFRLGIDTWVGPGNQQGAGWLVDATLHYRYSAPGTGEPLPFAVLPLWEPQEIDYGDPGLSVSDQIPARRVRIPEGTGRVEVRAFVTGHGQGNADNCAEFCSRQHTLRVGHVLFRQIVWRDDCESNPLLGQMGSWQYPRAGWCPGALVEPWIADVTAAIASGVGVEIAYDVEPHVNSCRPDAPTCEGCTLGTGCAYDGGQHTPPFYLVSAVLIVYP